MNILYAPASGNPEVLVSLNAEKAVDRFEWDYLTAALYRFGFGPKFIAWVKIIYFSPMASVRTNNLSSDYFPLDRIQTGLSTLHQINYLQIIQCDFLDF